MKYLVMKLSMQEFDPIPDTKPFIAAGILQLVWGYWSSFKGRTH